MENSYIFGSIIGPIYLVVGLSLLFYVDQWVKMIKEWEKNHFVLIIGALLNLIIGLVIINMHNIWAWTPWVIITLTGWVAFVKGVFYFLAPGSWIKAMIRTFCSSCQLYTSGLVVTILGAWLSYLVFLA